MHRTALKWGVFALATLLGACGTVPSHGYYEHDGPLRRQPAQEAPDAVPRALPLSRSGNSPYTVFGRTYVPLPSACGYRVRGTASWYGRQFYKGRTSDGSRYNMFAMTAAHKTLPLPSFVRVTNLRNGRSVIVEVNDRGPFLRHRLIDLSYAAARRLHMLGTGTAPVEVVSVEPGCAQRGHFVQVGSFSERSHAQALVERLQRRGLGEAHIETVRVHHRTWYAVRLGPLASAEATEKTQRALARLDLPAVEVPNP